MLSIALLNTFSAKALSSAESCISVLPLANSDTISLNRSLTAKLLSSLPNLAFISLNTMKGLRAATRTNICFLTSGSFISASSGKRFAKLFLRCLLGMVFPSCFISSGLILVKIAVPGSLAAALAGLAAASLASLAEGVMGPSSPLAA